MADLTVVNPSTFTGAQPVPATVAAGGDRFPVTRGRKYFVRVNNGDGALRSVVFDDPTTATPPGAQAFDPDWQLDVPNGAAPANQRTTIVDADRFADVNGWVNLTYTPAPTAVSIEIYGPLPT